ncbi:hypothetical protein EH2_00788 [Bacillus subtilis]|nr:hypothetical protein EH2_00788 [Bacillus subtilis]
MKSVDQLDFIFYKPKGLINRARAYKAKVDKNKEEGLDVDAGVNMRLYTISF